MAPWKMESQRLEALQEYPAGMQRNKRNIARRIQLEVVGALDQMVQLTSHMVQVVVENMHSSSPLASRHPSAAPTTEVVKAAAVVMSEVVAA